LIGGPLICGKYDAEELVLLGPWPPNFELIGSLAADLHLEAILILGDCADRRRFKGLIVCLGSSRRGSDDYPWARVYI